MSVNHKFNVFDKMYDILMILIDFWGQFSMIWLIFCYPDPADLNETDPDPQHWKEG